MNRTDAVRTIFWSTTWTMGQGVERLQKSQTLGISRAWIRSVRLQQLLSRPSSHLECFCQTAICLMAGCGCAAQVKMGINLREGPCRVDFGRCSARACITAQCASQAERQHQCHPWQRQRQAAELKGENASTLLGFTVKWLLCKDV